jgi:hypothetical protein
MGKATTSTLTWWLAGLRWLLMLEKLILLTDINGVKDKAALCWRVFGSRSAPPD